MHMRWFHGGYTFPFVCQYVFCIVHVHVFRALRAFFVCLYVDGGTRERSESRTESTGVFVEHDRSECHRHGDATCECFSEHVAPHNGVPRHVTNHPQVVGTRLNTRTPRVCWVLWGVSLYTHKNVYIFYLRIFRKIMYFFRTPTYIFYLLYLVSFCIQSVRYIPNTI